MQNPSHGVAQPLQNHVHLISAHRFPLIGSLSLEQAVRYLLDAPPIVKSLQPMSWTYVQAPQDGTLWLEWLTPEKNEGRFPSDGYVWGDPETTYRQDFGGYTIEIMVHTLGYRMQYDHMASHARTRYHLVAKNPSVNAAPPDPSLWIVHYHQAEHTRILPSGQVPFTPQSQQIMSERRWLESQGTLEKKDFMLHDRGSWPMIEIPRRASVTARQMQQPGFYGANVPQNRFPQYYPQQGGQPPQPKRQKMSGPIAGAAADGVHDTSIEDEENTTLGDFFDHLTPRDISMTRYMQHHRWMEEVFSSPYASAQIVPTDLGLGLMGELKGLTDGILEPPSLDFTTDNPQRPKSKEAQPFTNLKKEQIDEFNKRVEKHLEEGQAEIERMKAEHAAKMAEWKTSSKLMQAEKRLRHATWEGHESALPAAFQLEETAVNGHAEGGAKKEVVEDVVREVEGMLNITISTHKEANMIEKGGLEKEEEQPRVQSVPPPQQQQQAAPMPVNRTLPEAQTYHSDPLPPALPSVQAQVPMQQQQPLPQVSTAQQLSTADTSSITMADTTMAEHVGMNNPNFAFGNESQDIASTAQQAPPSQTQLINDSSLTAAGGMSSAGEGNAAAAATSADDPTMFGDPGFDEFTNMDETGGDGLIDFDSGGMNDDSMFGDALHGMDDDGEGKGGE